MSNGHSTLYNFNFERAVLSSVIFDPATFDTISIPLNADDFFLPFHRALYSAIEAIAIKEQPISDDFIMLEMQKAKTYDEMALLEVMSANPISNVMAYVKHIKQFSSSRKLQNLSMEMNKDIQAEDKELDDVLDMARDRLEEIESGSFSLELVSAKDLKEVLPTFHLKNWLPIPSSALSLISADGGVGKTWLVIQIAVRYVVEHKFEKKAFLWLSEDPEGVIKERLREVIEFLGYASSHDNIVHCVTFSTTEPPALIVRKGFKTSSISSKFYTIKKQLRGFGLIVFDPLSSFMGGDENDNSEASTFMKPFKKWCAEEDKSIVFLHHHTKGDGKSAGVFRGATTLRTSVRIAYEMDIVRDFKGNREEGKREMRSIKLTKDNWGGGTYLKIGLGAKFDRQIVPKSPAFEIEYEVSVNSYEMPTI